MDNRAEWGAPRTKTLTWYDPLRATAAAAGWPGIDQLRAIRDGRLPPPPIAGHFGFQIAEISAGEVTFTGMPDESVYNPIGVVHGGFVCTLLDTVIGCAVQSTLPAGTAYTSIDLTVNYLRALHGDTGELRARGWVTKPGRRVAFASGEVLDGDGRCIASGSGSCLVITPAA